MSSLSDRPELLLLLMSMAMATVWSCSTSETLSLEELACVDSSECPEGTACVNKLCTANANEDVVLDLGDSSGVETISSRCGDVRCRGTEDCCGLGNCVDTMVDARNCGECGTTCRIGETCTDGSCLCGVAVCQQGQSCCDGVCKDILTNVSDCGACGTECGPYESCFNGSCACEGAMGTSEQCLTGQSCCQGLGCRWLGTDPTSCGACGVGCQPGETCETGVCQCGATTCNAGQSCCGSPATCRSSDDVLCVCGGVQCRSGQLCCALPSGGDACTTTQYDSRNCGACGRTCGPGENCQSGVCACQGTSLKDCVPTQPGCETNILADVNHCGACGNACDAGELCVNGACACMAGFTRCDGVCVNEEADHQNCGGCGVLCTSAESCEAGTCVCRPGFKFCGGECIDVDWDVENCGGCGANCLADPHVASAFCNAGSCEYQCNSGWGHCSANLAGCTESLTTTSNCGACGNACPGINGSPTCTNQTCQVNCFAGSIDCDNDVANGCESSVSSDLTCGGCTVQCLDDSYCSSGVCNGCPNNLANCDPMVTGCETQLGTTQNCGACDNVCSGGLVCSGGNCI